MVSEVVKRGAINYRIFFLNRGCRSLLNLTVIFSGVTAQGFMIKDITRLFTFSFNSHTTRIKKQKGMT